MTNLWLKIKIWTKVTLTTIAVLYVVFFAYNNGAKQVDIWWMPFNDEFKVRLIPLLFFTFLIGILMAILVRAVFRTIRQVREMRLRNQTEKLQQEMADMKLKAAKLQTRPEPPSPPEQTAP